MGIITLAVICNLKASIKNTKEILEKLEDIEETCQIAFRNPFSKKHERQILNAKKSMNDLLKELKKTLDTELKYCTEEEYKNYIL